VQQITRFRLLLVRAERWAAAGSLLLLLVLAMTQVAARNLFDTGFVTADTLSRYLVLYVTFFGATLALERDRHIKIDVACGFLSAAVLHRLQRPMSLLAALVCLLFTVAAVRFWRDAWAYAPAHEQWLVLTSLVIPLGFGLLTLQYLLLALFGRLRDPCCLP
jgi:TRAP-type C4-dicarboxylate transport system permease small subunit